MSKKKTEQPETRGSAGTHLLGRVFAVGATAFACDLYANRDAAIAAALNYIADDHWRTKLSLVDQEILRELERGQYPELIIEFYNQRAAVDDRWIVSEMQVR